MKFDIFLSLCQAEVDGFRPSEQLMFEHFFEQVSLADRLGFGIAWVAENHFSSEVQKGNRNAVIPHFRGEVGINTDFLHLAHRVFASTQRIELGSAIRNILCNGGPLAHAEALRMFLSVHGSRAGETRRIHCGFAAGRFAYSNAPYGICPRSKGEEVAWPILKGKIFLVACEVFLRALNGEAFSAHDVAPLTLQGDDFPSLAAWEETVAAFADDPRVPLSDDKLWLVPYWSFERLALVPREAPLHLLNLVIGSHDPRAQELANRLRPTWVFNLSITPDAIVESTHQRMHELYARLDRRWQRDYMPRTVLVFLNADADVSETIQNERAECRARATLASYWRAMQGTVAAERITESLGNALWGSPGQVAAQITSRFHPDDRLMLWFDFNCHDNALVKEQMSLFCERVRPLIVARKGEGRG